jgi:hypothetical protein
MEQKPVESADLRSITAMKNIKKPLGPNVEAGDEVLIVSDTDHDPAVWKLVATAVADLGAEPLISLFETRVMDYYDPPEPVGKQMK